MRSEANVIDLRRRRIGRLADELEPFLRRGHAVVEVDRLSSADEWRAAARLSARRNGWRVRTGASRVGGRVFAVRVDPESENSRNWR